MSVMETGRCILEDGGYCMAIPLGVTAVAVLMGNGTDSGDCGLDEFLGVGKMVLNVYSI